mgnify:CR=1 FL=1
MLCALDHEYSHPSSQPTTIQSQGRLPVRVMPSETNVFCVFTPVSMSASGSSAVLLGRQYRRRPNIILGAY